MVLRCEACGWLGSQSEAGGHACPALPSAADYQRTVELLGDIAAVLRLERQRRHLSLREAAAQSGVPFTSLSRVERGAIPSLPTAVRILHWAAS